MRNACQLPNGGAAPATPGFNAFTPEWLVTYGAVHAPPAVPATESTLGSHPCAALSSAQVFPEWINRNLAGYAFAANGDNPLNFVSHSRGSLHSHLFTFLAHSGGLQSHGFVTLRPPAAQVSARDRRPVGPAGHRRSTI